MTKSILGSIILCSALALAACGSGGSSAPLDDLSATAQDGAGADCVSNLGMAGHQALWTNYQCGNFEYKWITPSTRDTDTGATLGKMEVDNGMVSVKFTGLLNQNFSWRETFAIYFQALDMNGSEASWRFTSKYQPHGRLVSYLGVQRWGAGCLGSCNDIFDTEELQFLDPKETYQWICGWNVARNRMYCDITKPADPAYYVHTWNIPKGRWASLVYMGVGRNAYTGNYPNYLATISDFRLTIFD